MRRHLLDDLAVLAQSAVLGAACLLPLGVFAIPGLSTFIVPSDEAYVGAADEDGEWQSVAPIVTAMAIAPAMVPIADAAPAEDTAAAVPVAASPATVAAPAAPVATAERETTVSLASAGTSAGNGRPPAHTPESAAPAGTAGNGGNRRCAQPEAPSPYLHTMKNGNMAVDRDLLSYYSKHVSAMSDLGFVASHEGRDGHNDGFRVGGMSCNNVLQQAGLKNGDVVHSINGKHVNNLVQALGVYLALRDETRIELEITRKGHAETLVYRLHD
jgi:hypothetical protein